MNTISFDQFVGLDGLVRRLGAEFGENRYVHAYLFSGPAGRGSAPRRKSAPGQVHCAGEPRPCGKCPSCQRMLAGTHPDHTAIGASGRSMAWTRFGN
jgi:DNA polymerase III gamma/tau subunit